jgi:hypothetical protein
MRQSFNEFQESRFNDQQYIEMPVLLIENKLA